MAILSVDLAYKSYADIGVVILEQADGGIRCDPIRLPSSDLPYPQKLAQLLHDVCSQNDIRLLMLDGPQGWKADDNDLMHSRRCERELNTPAKTGAPFEVKPANYAPFVKFSVQVYDALGHLGWKRLFNLQSSSEISHRWLIETFPLSAWRTLGIKSLPSKRKCRGIDLTTYLDELARLFPLRLNQSMTHDEIQATVSGLAGLAIESGQWKNCKSAGVPPSLVDGQWREGFIVNRTRPS
jgi:hypothetical protein